MYKARRVNWNNPANRIREDRSIGNRKTLLIARSAFTEALRPSFHAVLLLTGVGLFAVSPVQSLHWVTKVAFKDISLSSMLAVGLLGDYSGLQSRR